MRIHTNALMVWHPTPSYIFDRIKYVLHVNFWRWKQRALCFRRIVTANVPHLRRKIGVLAPKYSWAREGYEKWWTRRNESVQFNSISETKNASMQVTHFHWMPIRHTHTHPHANGICTLHNTHKIRRKKTFHSPKDNSLCPIFYCFFPNVLGVKFLGRTRNQTNENENETEKKTRSQFTKWFLFSVNFVRFKNTSKMV